MISVEARLREECEMLRERVSQLETALAPAMRVPVEWRLRKQEAQLFAALTTRDWLRTETLDAAVRLGSKAECDHLVRVIVYRVRQKLGRFGVVIENIPGEGYRLLDRERWARILA